MKASHVAHDHYVRNVVRASIVIAVMAAAGLGLNYYYRTPRPIAPTASQTASLAPIPTPESFRDFIGAATAVQPDSLTVQMVITLPSGQSERRSYQVTVSPDTEVAVYTDNPAGPEIEITTLASFRVGDLVGVFADQNIQSLTSFTAIKVYKMITS